MIKIFAVCHNSSREIHDAILPLWDALHKNITEIQKKEGLAMEGIQRILWNNRFFLIAAVLVLFLNIRFDFYYIKTGSMEPELPVGTIVVVDAAQPVSIGDVYGYRSGRNVVIHRIVAVDGEGYTFKGDANPSTDAVKVTEGKLAGKVILKITVLAPVLRWMGIT